MSKKKNNPRKPQNKAKDNSKPAEDLTKIPNPPVEDLSDEELNKVAGGFLKGETQTHKPYIKLQ